MKRIGLLLALAVVLLAPTTALAHEEGRVTQQKCVVDEYGKHCYSVWESDDGHITRGRWSDTSADGRSTSKGWWRINWQKGFTIGGGFSQWFYQYFFGGKG